MCKKNHADTLEQALSTLAATGKRLDRIARKLRPKQAEARPAPGKWSAKEILCHLADCEIVMGLRYRKIVSEPGGLLVAFDQDAWADRLEYRKQSMKQAIATFQALRAGHLSLLKGLPPSAWRRNGQHPEYGPLSLRQIILHIAEHDRKHLEQLQRLAG
jgi:uncharacterized damage-inducible protein DinB